MTASMVWFFILSRSIFSVSSRISPSMRARVYPCRRNSSKLLAIFSLASPHQGGQHLDARGRGLVHHLIDDLLHCLRCDDASAAVANGGDTDAAKRRRR